MKQYTIGICGNAGEDERTHNGQAVKTRNVYAALQQALGPQRVSLVNSCRWTRRPLRLLFRSIRLAKASKTVIIMPCQNGLRVFLPLYLLLARLFHFPLIYIVIGGWLPELAENNPRLVRRLRRLDGIYIETQSMAQALQALGLDNARVMPNFKHLTKAALKKPETPPFRFCTFSRVLQSKGIEEAIDAVCALNEAAPVACLDIYGNVDPAYQERFDRVMAQAPDYIRYCGAVKSDASVDVLKDYYALLFPSYYEGECFPGTFLDAFFAGIPVAASDWHCNAELIRAGQTGEVFAVHDVAALTQILRRWMQDPDAFYRMKAQCLQEADRYSPQAVIGALLKSLSVESGAEA